MRVLIAEIREKMTNYIAAAESVGFEAVPTLECPSPDELREYDGLILPGGGDVDPALYGEVPHEHGASHISRELDDSQIALLDAFVKAGKPVLAICRGHQLLNVYFGGTLIQDLGEKNTVHRFTGKDKVHCSRAESGSWLSLLYGEHYATNSAHHEAVGMVAEGFRVISESDDGVCEAIINDSLPIISIQWHPERMCCALKRNDTVDGSLVFRYFYGLCASFRP